LRFRPAIPAKKKLDRPFRIYTSLAYSTMNNSGKKNLTEQEVKQVVSALIDRSILVEDERKLDGRAIPDVAGRFGVTERTIQRIWKRAKENRETMGAYTASPQKKANSGRKPIYDDEELMLSLEAVAGEKRGTMRSVANELGISASTICRKVPEGIFRAHSSPLTPYLTEANKVGRFLYALERVREVDGRLFFHDAYDEVHVDEKWFNVTQMNKRMYLTPRENDPKRMVKHKSHIMKVMFLAAAARPRFDDDGNCTFDGKIGIWPFVEKVQAQRSSVNRPRGTWETKPVNVTKDVYREMMLQKVVPAIREKWPVGDRHRGVTVRIQQDNAPSHMGPDDAQWKATTSDNLRPLISLSEQPPNSPDMNVLDLGFFRALQSASWQQTPTTTIDGLIKNVTKAWDDYDPALLNRIWLTHASILNEVMEQHGNNHYKIPHMGKASLERKGELPITIELTEVNSEQYEHMK